jgi:hypothetical protein
MKLNRFTKSNPCPVCKGYDRLERGKGTRCHGFLSCDGNYAHCSRENFAGGLPLESDKSNTYAHWLVGDCRCGGGHNPSPDGFFVGSNSVVAEYDYTDEHGEVLFQVCRKNPKGFFQRKPDGKGGWENNLNGVRRVLYRLPELLEADKSETVFVCEGEADVENLRKLGLVATTNSSGAGKWRYEYNEHLRGRNVVILPDNDQPGREHAEQVSKSLGGIVASAKVVSLPGLPEKGDVSDWLNEGGTAERLRELASEQPTFERSAANVERKSLVTSAAELLAKEFPEPKFAINGLLSEGVTIFAGKPKLGKSWCTLGIAVAVASGGRALGSIPVQQGDVLYLALEDGPRRLKDRLEKVLGNEPVPERLDCATEWPRLNDGGIAELEAWVQSHPDARLIVVDTLKMVRPQERGRAKQLYDVDYEAIQPLAKFARDNGISVVVVHHTRKMESDDPLDLISGSFGLTGSADGILVLKKSRAGTETVLYSKGRDFDEQELALRWDAQVFGWSIVGNAEHLHLNPERRAIIDLIDLDGPKTPKQVATMLKRNDVATRKLMRAMQGDGQLENDGSGCYSVPAKRSSGNSSNSSNSTHSGNSSNSPSNEPRGNQSYPPLFAPGNSVNDSNVRQIADRVTRVTGDTFFELDDETAERAAIMEYDSNLQREEAERLARMEVASLSPDISSPGSHEAVAA